MERNLPVLTPLRHTREGMFIIGLIVLVAFLGLTNSWYLATMEVSGDPLICNVLDGCNLVAESPYSKLFGIPLSFLGVIFYFATLGSALGYAIVRHKILRRIISVMAMFGFLASLWFVYLQIFMIKALCEYCITSAIFATILVLLAHLLYRSEERHV